MKKLLLILLMLSLALFMGCSDDDPVVEDDPPPLLSEEQADSLSTLFMTEIMEEMQAIIDDPTSVGDMDLSDAEAGLQLILNDYPNHPEANLGMGIVEMGKVVSDDTLWELADSLMSDFDLPITDRGRIYDWNHPLISELPQLLVNNDRSLPDYVTVPFLQDYLHNNVIPGLSAAIGHLQVVEGDPDFNLELYLTYGEVTDTLEIDLGEIYVIDGALLGLRGVLRLLTAYDVDLAGVDGTYGWIDELEDSGSIDITLAEGGVGEGDTLYIEKHYTADGEVALLEMLQHQLDPTSDFLTLRTSPYSGQTEWTGGYDDLLAMLDKLDTAVTFIENEDDDQSHDLIPFELIEMLNDAIGSTEGLPVDVDDVHTLIAMVDEICTGPTSFWIYDYEEGVPVDSLEITINPSALFTSPVPDWKDKLFYHEWLPQVDWVVPGEPNYWTEYNNPDDPYSVWFDGDEDVYYNIVRAYWTSYDEYVDEPIHFLDGPNGSMVDPDMPGFFPHFPDYTFGDLFPGADRDAWLELMDFMEQMDD